MSNPIKLSKADARRAMVVHQFAPCATAMDVFDKLKSIQFDPIAPVGCNHDLVLQARVPGYKVGDWEKLAYKERKIYDGWDKQASLIPFEGWPWRQIFYKWHENHYAPIYNEFPDAIATMLKELEERGPMQPKDFEFQERRAEWKSTWYTPNVTKRILRALWHTGKIMTAGRKKGQHLYNLTERIVPAHLFSQPMPEEEDARRQMILERHQAVGILRPIAPYEVWSYSAYAEERAAAIRQLVSTGDLIPVDVEGVTAHATPDFLTKLDHPPIEPRVLFIGPLDQLVWDRKMIGHLFDFDYVWEIYVPEAKRRWGYYVLPVLYGDALVARAEFYCREGTVEMRRWHFEARDPGRKFNQELKRSLKAFMKYCRATTIVADASVDSKVKSVVESI